MKKKYEEQEIVNRLDRAVEALVPDIIVDHAGIAEERTGIGKAGAEKAGNGKTETVMPEKKTGGRILPFRRIKQLALVAAAACVILAAGLSYRTFLMVDTVIGLDINPSIELTVNSRDRILAVKALNEDAVKVLGNMDFRNVDYEIAVNAIIGSLVKHGYFAEAQNYILVSVENTDTAKADRMREIITADINSVLAAEQKEAVVMNQTVTDTEQKHARTISTEYGVSRNMAALFDKLIELKPELSYAELAAMSLDELVNYTKQNGINLEEVLDYIEGDDLDADDLYEPMDAEDVRDAKEDLEKLLTDPPVQESTRAEKWDDDRYDDRDDDRDDDWDDDRYDDRDDDWDDDWDDDRDDDRDDDWDDDRDDDRDDDWDDDWDDD